MASLEAARTHGVAKASWMLRQSDILCRWKHCFCVLYRNGTFTYYKDENRREEQGTIDLAKSCYAVNAGTEINTTTSPPPGKHANCMLELRTHQANMLFCTDSVDDSQAWKAAIVEVKNSKTQPAQPRPPAVAPPPHMAPPPPYSAVQVAAPPPAQQVMINPGGTTTTYTTYPAAGTQYVVQPASRTVVVNGQNVVQSAYPVQRTVYAYPGQTCMYTCTQQPNASTHTTVVYNQRRRDTTGDAAVGFIAGAALGACLMGPILW